ncbi:PREDICTED: cytoplasmic dynein 2 heavy chain 1-like [Papilio polytes]|uniref:cytoplasmic dynein 2 heavy chain 1-like n=1 Tax=Papilio polytes TaxID=76194 RepID=UPI0006763D9B|nr:PREDICTED: cytoplasmic dynein 2 heavy chain 1-like [Papilio polytes]
MSKIREFVISTAEPFYNVSDLKLNDKAEDALYDFIHNSQTYLLQTGLNKDILDLTTQIQCDIQKSIIFYKTSPVDLSKQESINNVNIITISTGAAESLYQILRQIFSPLLSLGDDLYTNKLQKNLTDLENNLRILTHGKNTANINVILTIEDEVDYWRAMAEKREASKKEREAASNYQVLFEDICEEIKSMQASAVHEMRDNAENIGGILDDIWRCTVSAYSQDRMIHIFDIIGHLICRIIQKIFSGVDVWKVHNSSKDDEVLKLINESLNVVETWISACVSLTETYWPNYALHAWSGKNYVPQFCVNFQKRVKEIYDLRSIHNQLNKLLTNKEKSDLKTDELFEPFTNINVWICNGKNPAWENAVLRFSSNLRPSESKIAEKLRPRLHNTSTKQMLYEFMRYRCLMSRPAVQQALSGELQMLVSSLGALVRRARAPPPAAPAAPPAAPRPPHMSPLVHHIQFAKHMEAKIKEIKMCIENYLKEFQGSEEVSRLADEVLIEIKNSYTQLHEEWSRDIQAQVKSGSLQLCAERPVVQFCGQSRLLQVNFSPLNFYIVASFHNTLGERMIPSTRPMMLQAALELAALVQDHRPVYWQDTDQLADYTDKLKNMVLKLETQNSYLTSQHIAIRNIVEKLFDTELLVKQADWKKSIKLIRDIIEKVESEGYKNSEQWRAHWDWQLCKALECQYINTLLSLHTHFPQVRVDLVLRGRMVVSQPGLEELRVQHYHQLRRLVSLPNNFVGLSTALDTKQTIFASIVDKHSWLGNKAVSQLEAALGALRARCAGWARRLALGCAPDLAALCAALRLPHHWETNFKACKAYGQDVAKMTFEDEKISWITVCTATLRQIVKSRLKGEWENLSSCVEACVSRWARARARLEGGQVAQGGQGADYAEMRAQCHSVFEAQQQWEKYLSERDELLKECQKFNMDVTISDTWKDAEKLIKESVDQWEIFKDYDEEYESIGEQEWLVFQKKLHLLDEFCIKWCARFEPYTSVTLFLKQTLDKYTDLTIALKYLRGSDFTEHHWREVFSLLDMQYKSPETLKLKDLLNVADNIKKQIKALQKISCSASNESAVRSALSELEVWFAGARLALAAHTDKANRPVTIVKDFTDILNKVTTYIY